MAGKRRNRTPIEQVDDRVLLEGAAEDDADAVRELHRRSAPSAWAFALTICGSPEGATEAATTGFANAVAAVRSGVIGPDDAFRPFVLAETRAAAVVQGDHLRSAVGTLVSPDSAMTDAALAFAELPEAWRSALWLSDVVMLPDDQLEVPLQESTANAEAMVRRARGLLYQHMQRRMEATTIDAECALVTGQLADLLAGDLDDLAAEAVNEHLSACSACRARRERLVSATDRLSGLAPTPPADFERQSLARWRADADLPPSHSGQIPAVPREDGIDDVGDDEPAGDPHAPVPSDEADTLVHHQATTVAAAGEAVADTGEGADLAEPADVPDVVETAHEPDEVDDEVGTDEVGTDEILDDGGDGETGGTTEPDDEPEPLVLAAVGSTGGSVFAAADADRFEAPEPKLAGLRNVATKGPIAETPRRRKIIAAAAAVLVLVAGAALATHENPSQEVRTAQGDPGQSHGRFSESGTTLPPLSAPVPPSIPDLGVGALPSPVLPAGSGSATAGQTGTTAARRSSSGGSSTGGSKSAGGPTGTAAPTTTVPKTTTTARYCVRWLLNRPPANPLEELLTDPCVTWSS